VTKTWKINRAVVKAKVEGTSPPADIANYYKGLCGFCRERLWLVNCYFAHFSSGSQLNVTMLRWAENG
jgi:hypothetical protein